MRISEIFKKRHEEERQADIGALGEAVYGISNKFPRKKAWYEDASYTYHATPTERSKKYLITFKFPNAASGPKEFTTWLYQDGQKGRVTNFAAEMLQCYIDREPLL